MANRVMAHIVTAYTVMADTVMTYTVMAYVLMAYTVMAYIVMAYIVMDICRYLAAIHGDRSLQRCGGGQRKRKIDLSNIYKYLSIKDL